MIEDLVRGDIDAGKDGGYRAPVSIRAPRDSSELMRFVEFMVPRARLFGTRVTAAEQRALGFIHALLREAADRKAKMEDIAATSVAVVVTAIGIAAGLAALAV